MKDLSRLELPIDTMFTQNGELFKVIQNNSKYCRTCYFHQRPSFCNKAPRCARPTRKDKKNVYFVRCDLKGNEITTKYRYQSYKNP